MAENNNDKLVVAYYVNAAAARAAADDLKEWDKDNDDVKLGAIGIMTVDPETGKLQTEEVGESHTKRGTLWGTAIGAGLAVLSAGIALIPGMVVGAAAGAAGGKINHKSLGMTDEDVHEIAQHLKLGGAALGVMCDDFEIVATTAKMVVEGGKLVQFDLDGDAVEAVAETARVQQEASEAALAEAAEPSEGAAMVAAAVGHDEDAAAKAESLLQVGASAAGREMLADATGIDEETILLAVKKMDLQRIKGVGKVYAELLYAAGIDSVPDLAQRDAMWVHRKMEATNSEKQISETMPSEETVAGWIEQAQEMPPVVTY